ncbi:ABC transporter permease [Aquimarina sp. 2-A2]|uniref:ABC transporter permease n=1 Tax=Aquimarina sp. 2-A2 TaxID=3382644 RepID=UPI00387F326A
MKISLYIAKRYLFSPGSSNAINIITGIAAMGVVIGALSLFLVLSGFAGLKDFSLRYTSFFDPDLKISPSSGKTLDLTPKDREQLQAIEEIASYAEVVEERVFLEYKNKPKTAYIKGVSESYAQVIAPDSILIYGDWLGKNDFQIVAGNGISRELGMGVERTYTNFLGIYVPKPGKGIPSDASKAFRKQRVVPIGIYSVNEELDAKYVFSTIGMARNLLALSENQVSAIEIKLKNETGESEAVTKLAAIFEDRAIIKNRVQLNETLYRMLNTENLVSYLVITLIAVIALFNVAGAIIMMIIDKKGNIKTLYNLGTSLPELKKIFLYQGLLMTVLGTILGLFLGLILILAQQHYGLLMITPNLAYPTRITPLSFIVVFLTITTIGGVASYLASSRINQKLLR